MTRAVLLIALCTATTTPVRAQSSCTADPSPCSTAAGALQVTITIAKTYELTLSSASTALAAPTPAIYNAGFAATTGPTATIRSNAAWTLSISSVNPTWSAANTEAEPARTNKPASDLMWSTSSTGTFTGLTTSAVQIASGPRSAATTVSIFYRTLYQWNLDTPGNYSLQVVFTIVAP